MKKVTYYINEDQGLGQTGIILSNEGAVELYRTAGWDREEDTDTVMTDEEIMKDFLAHDVVEVTGDLIKEKRTKAELTQSKVAIACGVGINTYRNWESGVTTPNEENIVKLRGVLGF